MIRGSGIGPKVSSLKRQVRSHVLTAEIKNGTLLWREARFQVNMYKTPHVQGFFEVRMSKNGTPLWREGHLDGFGPLVEVRMSKNCTPLWREAHLQGKMYGSTRVLEHFSRFRVAILSEK